LAIGVGWGHIGEWWGGVERGAFGLVESVARVVDNEFELGPFGEARWLVYDEAVVSNAAASLRAIPRPKARARFRTVSTLVRPRGLLFLACSWCC
jgi:hypothetical protein